MSTSSKNAGEGSGVPKSPYTSLRRRIVDEGGESVSSDTSTSGSDASNLGNKKSKGSKELSSKYAQIPFDYSKMTTNAHFIPLHTGKAPLFDGTHYAKWKHTMRLHLISLHPSVWEVVCVGVNLPDEDIALTPDQQQSLYRNAQAASVILGALSPEEFNKVEGIEEAKKIWDTLRIAHEGSSDVRRSKIELLEGKLGRFVMLEDETTQQMFDRLMRLVNEIRGLGKKKSDHSIVKHLLRAVRKKFPTLVTMTRERPDYKKLTPSHVLGKLLSHEQDDLEAEEVERLVKGESLGRKNIALKAKKEKIKDESSDDDDSIDEDEFALFMKQFKKFAKKGAFSKDKRSKQKTRRSKRGCYRCGEVGHFIADCPKANQDDEKKKDKHHKSKNFKKKVTGEAHIGKEWESNDESSESSEDEKVANIAVQASASHKSLFGELSDDDNEGAHTCLMAKENKVKTSSSPNDDDEYNSDACDVFLKGVDKKSLSKLKKLLKEIASQEDMLERQEDLLIIETEKNLALEASLKKEKEKVKELSKKVNSTTEACSSLRESYDVLNASYNKLKGSHHELQKSYGSLQHDHKELKLKHNNLVACASSSQDNDAKVVDKCDKCAHHDLAMCDANLKKVEGLEREIKRLEGIVKNGFDANAKQHDKLPIPLGRAPNAPKYGCGFVPTTKIVGEPKFVSSHVIHALGSSHAITSHAKQPIGSTKLVSNASKIFAYAEYMLMRNQQGKVVAKVIGTHTKSTKGKKCVWVPKVLITNVKGPKSVWVPKSQA
jgi:gag-polypeptide of LTR copia-type/Zinc knuckle